MAKAQKLDLELKGMVTNLGDLSKPNGALTIAKNLDFPTSGFMPKRRGITRRETIFGATNYSFIDRSIHQLLGSLTLQKKFIAHIGNIVNMDKSEELWLLNDGTNTGGAVFLDTPDAENVESTTAIRSRLIQDTKNHFVGGVHPAPIRLESNIGVSADAVSYAGMPRPPGIHWDQQVSPELKPGTDPQFWLAENFSVGYRCTFVTKDEEGKERESAPSGRYIVANMNQYDGWVAGRPAIPITRWQIPFKTNTLSIQWAADELTIRVYRSVAVNIGTSLPNDEMQLAYEAPVKDTDIINGYVTVADYTPEFALGAYLYTNSISGGDVGTGLVMSGAVGVGLAAENDRPPYCTDVANFANCAFYSNIIGLSRVSFSIVAVGVGSEVMEAGDTLQFLSQSNSITQTAVGAAPAAANEFRIYTSTSPSLAWSIRRTCENLCASINAQMQIQKFDGVATYIGNDSSPGTVGKIMVESLRQQDDTMNVYTALTPGTAIQPFLGEEGGTIVGERDINPNGLAISKPLLLDSVPPINYTSITGPDSEIQRIIAVSDALFIFLNKGIWICRGTGPSNFVFQPFDTDFRIWNRESAVAYKDHVYVWGYEGIVRVSVGGGIERIDMPIRNTVEAIWQYINPFNSVISPRGWAMSQSHWNRILFFYPFFDEDQNNCTRALVYHIDTGAWTTYDFFYNPASQNAGWNCGFVRPYDSFSWFGFKTQTYNETFLGLMQNSSTDYYETTDMAQDPLTNYPVVSTIRWATTIPNPNGLTSWSYFEFFTQPYLYADPTFLSAPTGGSSPPVNTGPYQVEIVSDLNATTASSVALFTQDKGRLVLSKNNGLATRQTVTIVNSSGFTSFTGMSFLIRPLSGFNTK